MIQNGRTYSEIDKSIPQELKQGVCSMLYILLFVKKTRPGDLVICRTHWDNFVANILTIFYHFGPYKSQSKL